MNYLTQNSKMKNSSTPTYNWGIPAFMSKSGMRTCPFAGECVKGCYARQGAYVWSNVSPAFERRLELSQSDDFVPAISLEIKRRRIKRVRIHDSGDFYSTEYRDRWFDIMDACPDVEFYAYTKSFPFFEGVTLPSNFTLIFSEGGKLEVPSESRHSRVFESKDELDAAGYADASKDDSVALGNNPKIGLIYHGAKSKKWSTG